MNPLITYPQFRKYKNNKVYFKIISAVEWEEIHVSAHTCRLHLFMAKILPDRNYIADMTYDYKENWEAIEETEYESMKKKCAS